MEEKKTNNEKKRGGVVLAEIYTGERWFNRKKREENRWESEEE